jgi:outer membrane protein assembly factor BamB
MSRFRTSLLMVVAVLGLSACSSWKFWEKSDDVEKPAELKPISATAKVDESWKVSVGKSRTAYLQPTVVDDAVFAASADGDVYRIEKGRTVWRTRTDLDLAAGVGASRDLVVVGGVHGVVVALDAATGKQVWKIDLLGEISAQPFVDANAVLMRVGDSRIVSLDVANGNTKWTYDRATPPLSLRTYDELIRFDNYVFGGFAGGKIAAVTASNGQLAWEGSVTLPRGSTELERLSDVVGVPVPIGKQLCAASYQGKVTCFDVTRGVAVWGREISTAVGIDADDQRVYVSDDRGAVYALDMSTGATLWKQDALKLRQLGRPLVTDAGVAVADFEGWIHLLDKKDGRFIARTKTDGSPVRAPLMRTDDGFVAQTTDGGVFAFRAR